MNWEQLLPPQEREHFSLVPPPAIHDYLAETAPAAAQSGSSAVNPALEGVAVQLIGFIVPIELTPSGSVSGFFLVPYVGACVHVPPPAPNQMIYIHIEKPLPLLPLYEAYTVSGLMHAQPRGSGLGAAAYTMDLQQIERYGN